MCANASTAINCGTTVDIIIVIPKVVPVENLDESRCESNDPFSNNDFDAKAMLRRQVVDLKIRIAAMNCCLKSAVGSDVSKNTLSFIKKAGDCCYDSLFVVVVV